MNELQKRFFKYLADTQELCVQSCMIEYGCSDEYVRNMLYDATYGLIAKMMELIDGYSDFDGSRLDLIDTTTGKSIKEGPFIELHDHIAEFLRYD